MAASGSVIRNEGEKKISAYTDEGMPIDLTWQIAGVKKPLASVGRICDAGNVAKKSMSSADEVSVSAMPQTASGGEQHEGREEEGQGTVPEAEEQVTVEMVLDDL